MQPRYVLRKNKHIPGMTLIYELLTCSVVFISLANYQGQTTAMVIQSCVSVSLHLSYTVAKTIELVFHATSTRMSL